MVTAFSNDLATDPYNTLLRVASHPLTSSGSFVTVPLIYYIARTDKKCAQTFDCIRQAVRDFTEEYLRNPKNFIETNKLNWKSTKDLAECFSKNTL